MTYIRSIEDLRREVDTYTCNHDMSLYSIDYETLVQSVADDLIPIMREKGWKWGDEMPVIGLETWFELIEQYEKETK